MHHIFLTSIAEDHLCSLNPTEYELGILKRSNYIKYETYEDRVYDTIDFYLKKCSKFYLTQVEYDKKNTTFEVYVSYGKRLLPIVEQFEYPDYMTPIVRGPFHSTADYYGEVHSENRCDDFVFTDEFKERHEGEHVSVTLIDADDILSNRVFGFIERSIKDFYDFPYFLLSYNVYRQFNRATEKYTKPIYKHDPPFATLCYPSIGKHIYNHRHPLAQNVQLHPHGNYPAHMGIEAQRAHAINTIGTNIANFGRWHGYQPNEHEANRLSEFGGIDDDYVLDGFVDVSGWNPVKGKLL